MNTQQEVLQACTVDGTTVYLPEVQLDRKLYQQVAKALGLIGGKWNRKAKGFVFQADPTDLLAQIADGQKRDLKKEFQFFATPPDLADHLVELAEITLDCSVLEPSAGQGALINAVHKQFPQLRVFYCELMDVNRNILAKLPNVGWFGNDIFDEKNEFVKFDRIIANPPFSKNQDIDHIRKYWDMLEDDGILVSVASKHWTFSQNRKETEFREWLDEIGADVDEIEPGRFKESGTMVGAMIIRAQKAL
jgi:hypothetical protein